MGAKPCGVCMLTIAGEAIGGGGATMAGAAIGGGGMACIAAK
jgi:hypothetical protein